jgi:hypothetical protein
MARLALSWIAAILIELSFVAVVCSQSTHLHSPRAEAWKLARESIQESGIRKGIPKFINWTTSREIFPCGDRKSSVPLRVAARDFLDESFHYNPQAAARLCEPLAPATGALALDAALPAWEKSESKPQAMDPPFPPGAQLGAAFWNAVRRPADPGNGKIVQMAVRSGQDARTRKIRITLPARLRTESAACGRATNPGDPGTADAADVSLDEFFWVRLNRGERYNGASCGDFAVLMAFHLVHKVQGRWLWTTFWWDPESKEFGRDRPKGFQGAGEVPKVWQNYAMDASFESTGTIFNPWRIEERGENCARCHGEVTSYKSATSAARITFDSVTAARAHFQ